MNKRERKKKKMKMRMKRIKYCTHSSSSSSSVSSATDYTTSEEDNDGRQLRGSTSAGESGTGCVFIKAVFSRIRIEQTCKLSGRATAINRGCIKTSECCAYLSFISLSYFLFVNHIVKLQIATTRERPKKSTLFIMQPMNIQCRFLGTIMRFTKVIV